MHSATDTLPADAIRLKRAYAPAATDDGLRILVDRLWARGLSKEGARLDAWMKELGPSGELRQWFGHRPERWDTFRTRYQEELTEPLRQLFLLLLQSAVRTSAVTLVYGARDTQQNEAVILRDYLRAHAMPPPDDTSLVVLAAVAAVAAAQPGDEAPVPGLMPFLSALSSKHLVEALLRTLQERGDLQEEKGGWRLSARGKRLLQVVPDTPGT